MLSVQFEREVAALPKLKCSFSVDNEDVFDDGKSALSENSSPSTKDLPVPFAIKISSCPLLFSIKSAL